MEQLLVDAAEAEDEATRDITNSYNPNPDGVNPHPRWCRERTLAS